MNDHEEFETHDDPTEAPHQAHPIFAVLPFVIIFLVLGALALLYVKKFGENPPPKPSAVATVTKAEDTWKIQDCTASGDYIEGGNTATVWNCGGKKTVWLHCNAGMEVTDLRNCPEYKRDDQIVYSDHSVFGHGKHKHRHSYGDTLWTGEPLDGKRHKRPTHPTLTWTWASVPRDEWTFISTVPSIVTCSKLKASEYGQCESRPLTSAEIEQYKPVAKVSNGDEGLFTDLRSSGLVGDGGGLVDSKSASDRVWTAFNAVGGAHPTTCPEAGCEDGWDPGENAYACVNDGKLQPLSQTSCADSGLKPAKWPTIASVQIVLTEQQRNAYASNLWMKPCGPDNHDSGCYTPDKPDCKMPADVDVCPVQTLDKKERHD